MQRTLCTASFARRLLLATVALVAFAAASPLARAGAPTIFWKQINTSGLAANVGAVAWSPNGTLVANGNSDRNLYLRNATTGVVVANILQPRHSDTVVNLRFSGDSAWLAVRNSAFPLTYRVYRVADTAYAGSLVATVDGNGIAHLAPDADLAATGGVPAKLSSWAVDELPISVVTGTSYHKVVTTLRASPNGTWQTAAASNGGVTVQRRSDGAVLASFGGGAVAFAPDSTLVASWSSSPNRIELRRTSDFALVRTMSLPDAMEGGIALRFSPNGATLLSSGYLPFLDPDGTWNQKGTLRFWTVASGAQAKFFDAETGLAVTSGTAYSASGQRFIYGTYEGTTVVALTP